MDHNKIQLSNIQKMFVFEQQSRIIDSLSKEDAINFAKCYLKLYLKQQETLSLLSLSNDKSESDL
jgi:hypothetical protein